MKSTLFSLLACLAIMLLMPAAASAQDNTTGSDQNIVQLASENNDLTILVAALNAADLASTLEGEGPFTVFAPTDEAFRALPEEVFQALLKAENRQALVDILKYHVVEGTLAASDVTTAIDGTDNGEYQAASLNGDLAASMMDGTVMLSDPQGTMAHVTQADIMASNGVIHLIDAVLIPENVDVEALTSGVTDQAEQGMSDVNAAADTTGQYANQVATEGQNMGREAGQEITEAGQEVREAGSEMGQEMTEAGQQTQQTVTEAGQEVREAGQEVGQETNQAVTEAGQEVREAGTEMGQEMTEAGQQTRQNVTEAGQEVREAGQEVGQETNQAVTEAGQEIREAGQEVGQEVNEAAQDVRRTTQEVGSDVTQQNRETSDSINDTSMNRMDDNSMDNSSMGNTTRRSTGADNNTIVDVAAANTDFRTLINAVETAELEDVLASDGEFTVFAPTEAAFGKLPSGTVDGLGKEDLQGVLTYHVVASKISAADLMKAIEANDGYFRIQTMGGGSLIASLQDGNVILTDGNGDVATVTQTDIEASNGVIHVIDTVMMPTKATESGDSMESNN